MRLILPPIHFNIVSDMLVVLIEGAKVDGSIEGVVAQLVDGRNYLIETIPFMDQDLSRATNLKLIFQHSSELFFFGEA